MQVGHYVLPLSSNECKTTSSVFEELLMYQLHKVFSVSKSLEILKRKDYHRRTGQEIWGGGQMLVCPTRSVDECRRGVRGHPPPGKFLNVESRKCNFPRFEDEIVPFLMLSLQVRTNCFHMIRKIARLLSRNCPTN